jgi:hypothetical protein
MDELKAITKIPGWATQLHAASGRLSKPALAYNKVPLIRRAVDLRCNALSMMPFEVNNPAGEPVGWQFDTAFRSLHLADGSGVTDYRGGVLAPGRRHLHHRGAGVSDRKASRFLSTRTPSK